MEPLHNPNQNHLLAAMSLAELTRMAPELELVTMLQGEVLYEAGQAAPHVYFPTSAIVSLNCMTESGATSDLAWVGQEGVIDIALVMGCHAAVTAAVVCVSGHGYRLKAQSLRREFNRAGGRRAGVMQHVLLRYSQALMTQLAQTAVCNRHHSVQQQLCRWLLSTLDRLPSNELTMTHEHIANMLGVRREGITEAAGHLQQAGLIRYYRGHITVLDRAGLATRVCECYAVVKKEHEHLLLDVGQRPQLVSIASPRRLYLASDFA
ncbi:Crp/Fnr family transcriptional regulator [Rhodoferax sp.]|uniref:Crp/Fnr family transcriptional regulator n=1 Tax=Rhodoferax sp. TaxID=50421 RepID=UPI0025E7C20C|nr:Crp/Fnr family transcriptional regulator [Rhodoferax sp.]